MNCDEIGTNVVRGNYNLQMSSFHCSTGPWGPGSGWDYVDNVGGSSTNACVAQTGSLATLTFANETPGATMDLHLSGTAGSNDGENDLASQYATTDIDGASRGSTPDDVGSDER